MSRPGDVMRTLLHQKGIQEKQGCGCRHIATKMNHYGKQGCLEHFNELVDEIYESIKEWRRTKRKPDDPTPSTFQEKLVELVQPPKFVIAELVEYCIAESTE